MGLTRPGRRSRTCPCRRVKALQATPRGKPRAGAVSRRLYHGSQPQRGLKAWLCCAGSCRKWRYAPQRVARLYAADEPSSSLTAKPLSLSLAMLTRPPTIQTCTYRGGKCCAVMCGAPGHYATNAIAKSVAQDDGSCSSTFEAAAVDRVSVRWCKD